MLIYPDIDPVAFGLGPLAVHWYGLMYVLAFGGAWWLAAYRMRQQRRPRWSSLQIFDLVYFGALGAVLGGRMGYVLFYGFQPFLADPLSLFRVWEGGMSFHGGLLGVLLAFYLYSRRIGRDFFEVMDFIAPFVPFGLGAGRLGNFIGGELWGRPTAMPWGMVFPHVDPLPRHPSQLYEMFLEGVLLFIIVWWFSAKPRPRYTVTGLFGLGYGAFRFLVEFYRAPDLHIGDSGFIAFGWLTMGQLLCIPMIVGGILLMGFGYYQHWQHYGQRR